MLIILALAGQIISSCGNKGKGDTEIQNEGESIPAQGSAEDQAQPPVPAAANEIPEQELFMEACLNGIIKDIEKYVNQGIEVSAADEDGRTGLMLAAFNGHTDIVRMLLDSGAGINLADSVGRTALLYAASGPFPKTVELLLQREADPNTVDNLEHFSALMHAAAEGHMDVVKVLLEHGADPSLTDIDGDNAESFARQGNHIDVAEYLKSSAQ